jgi:CHAD domain-containing protein
MPYRLQSDESVADGLARIAGEQLSRADTELLDPKREAHDGVHQARKRCKKVRGLLRLVRDALGPAYTRENTTLRDAARSLSRVRDAQAMVETLDDIREAFDRPLGEQAFARVRHALVARRDRLASQQADMEEQAQTATASLAAVRARLAEPELHAAGFAAIAPGLARTYRRGRKAFANAYEHPGDEHFHDWRKRVKYHWYHLRLLRDLWSPVLKGQARSLDALSDLLGDDHDLAVLRQALLAEPERFGETRDVQALLGLLDRRQAELRARAHVLGRRVYAEKPAHLQRRFAAYWEAWRTEGTADPRLAATGA